MDVDDDDNKPDRAAVRFLTSFLIDVVREGAQLQGSIDLGIVFTLVALANAEAAAAETLDADFAYHPIPDPRRRPLSASAISHELQIPKETARRQVAKLIERGALVRVGRGGVIVPNQYLARPEVQSFQSQVVASFLRMIVQMAEAGFAWPSREGATAARAWGDTPPTYLLMRSVLTFVLRVVRLTLVNHRNAEEALVLQAAIEINTRPVTHDPKLARRYASSSQPGVPDDLRQPASVSALVARTGVSNATVGRIIRRAATAGVFVKVRGGYIVPQALIEGPISAQGRMAVFHYFVALAHRLSALGIQGRHLEAWARKVGPE